MQTGRKRVIYRETELESECVLLVLTQLVSTPLNRLSIIFFLCIRPLSGVEGGRCRRSNKKSHHPMKKMMAFYFDNLHPSKV